MAQIRISGKDLGALALPGFCKRCFWVQRNAPAGLPYQIFPGIFSSIDAYTKNLVHSWFDRHAAPPPWLTPLGEIVGYRPPPHHTKFAAVDPRTGILLTGAPDAVFELRDGSLLIADYKTAKYTGTQDELFPMYRMQLNAYAVIAERIGYGRVSGLALLYAEPVTDATVASEDRLHRSEGFSMGFDARILPVALDPEAIPPLLDRVRSILGEGSPPQGRAGCKDCERLDGLVGLLASPPGREGEPR